MNDGFGGVRLQIDRDALLAAIERAEIGAVAIAQRRPRADQVALRSLDLDDLGAEVAIRRAQCGPASMAVKSSTRMPRRGPRRSFGCGEGPVIGSRSRAKPDFRFA